MRNMYKLLYQMATSNTTPLSSSLVKKYLMAITGLVLVLFVLGHMVGNLQMFFGPDNINHYAHALRQLPFQFLWIERFFFTLAVLVHAWIAALLTIENRRSHPTNYAINERVQASLASKTMGISGSVLLFFIVFHLMHFTLLMIFPEYRSEKYYIMLGEEKVYNVYKMVIHSFSIPWVSLLYIFCMIFLCMHLSHGVSSMFQTVGLRNNKWRPTFDWIAVLYGWIIFLGFISIPVATLISKYTDFKIFPI